VNAWDREQAGADGDFRPAAFSRLLADITEYLEILEGPQSRRAEAIVLLAKGISRLRSG